MNTDGTLLAISAVDPKCDGLNPFEVVEDLQKDVILDWASTDLCPTGSIQLYQYKPTNLLHMSFSRLMYKRDANSQSTMEEQKWMTDNTILGLQISLSEDDSKLAASGFGFVKSFL